jgi:osmoprotectant transport system ATP-binding protein
MGDRVIIMDKGKIQQYDTPYNILFRPENEFVARLVESENVIEKLQVLHVADIMTPIQSLPPNADTKNRVGEHETLSRVLGKFIEMGLPSLYVEDSEGRVTGQIFWNSFQSIPTRRDEKIEYYV